MKCTKSDIIGIKKHIVVDMIKHISNNIEGRR